MQQNAKNPTHDYHDGNDLNKPSVFNDRSTGVSRSIQHSKREFHELRMRPQKETLQPARKMIQLINRDPLFSHAKRTLGIFPQVIFKLVRSACLRTVQIKTAYVMSLFESEYFAVDKQGHYDPSIVGNQTRARNCLMDLVYGKKPIFLDYAGPSFFKAFPEFTEEKILFS